MNNDIIYDSHEKEVSPVFISGKCGENLEYSLHKNGNLYIYGSGAMDNYYYDHSHDYDYELYCDDEDFYLDDYLPPFNFYKTSIKQVVIEKGVTSIGDRTFEDCWELENISIPNSVTIIGEYAFYECYKLKSVIIPSSVNIIGRNSFENCKGLQSVTIQNGVRFIKSSAFSSCTALTDITIPDSVTIIESNAFMCCVNLTNVVLPASIREVDLNSFWGCVKMTSITIPASVESIENFFWFDSELCEIKGYRGSYAEKFANENLLDFISLGNVKIYSFHEQEKSAVVQSGKCGENVEYSLYENGNLYIYGSGEMEKYYYDFRRSFDCFGIDEDFLVQDYLSPFKSDERIIQAVIETGVTSIGDLAFEDCDKLEIIVIPKSVASISDMAFKGYYVNHFPVIKGFKGSFAEKYAEERHIKFISLDKEQFS